MADANETIADIIAEMRAREDLDGGDMVANFDIYNGEYGGWDALMLIKAYADRLEAAWKRERELTKSPKNVNSGAASDTAGNGAKLREALVEILEYIESFHKYIIPGKRKGLTTLFAVADTIRDKARAALSAPPRNCDKFGGDYKMLHTAWFDWTGSPSGQNPDGTAKLTFAKWLLAPATEGGAE